jgi:lipid-A-disaccharide synthase
MKTLRIYLIAGEPSGDFLGSQLMLALKARYSGKIEFFGVGGSKMTEAGLTSLFPMEEISLMGFFEILPHIPRLLKRIRQTAAHIHTIKPDLVVTIDSPGFNCRIAKKLKHRSFPLIHYVAPTVWAYKPKRAKKFAALFDHLLVLLPFEPPYFQKENLETSFVGHPVVEENFIQGNGAAFRKRHHIPEHATVLLAMPGSRACEVKRLMPIYLETFKRLMQRITPLYIVIPALGNLKAMIEEQSLHSQAKIIVIDPTTEKHDAFAAANFALVKSGTGTLEIAMARLPMVVTYKVSFFSYLLLKWMVHIKYATLLNLIMDAPIIPEYLQYDCTPAKLTQALMNLSTPSALCQHQLRETKQALEKLGYGQTLMPSQKAAGVCLGKLVS